MKKTLLLSLCFSTLIGGIFAQVQDPVLMKINGQPVSKSEFEYLYKKNNSSVQQPVDEYLKLFVDYKLKVQEALSQKLDTVPAFVKEFNGYKGQIAQPYLTDTVSELNIAKEIYGRLGESIESSHILIRLPQGNMLPKDTLAAYEKALSVRNMLFGKKPKTFEEAALEYSEDPSAKQGDRAGYLGWASAGMFVMPFDQAMFATKVGDVSMPVRSMFGYHLIKVHNRRTAAGKVNVSHIMFGFTGRQPSSQETDSVKQLAHEVYEQLKAGGNYNELCSQYSVDKQSSANGGNLGWITEFTRLPHTFLDASYALKNVGDITPPVKTDFGYHIIKLDEKKGRDTWEESKSQIISQVKNSDLAFKLNHVRVEKLEKEYGLKQNKVAFDGLKKLATEYFPTDSIFIEKAAANKQTLFSIAGKDYKVSDIADYVSVNSNQRMPLSIDALDYLLTTYKLSVLTEKDANSLEEKYPEYRNLLKEYHDGILLFNIMNAEVWDKVANDDDGLKNYFDKNKAKYNTWDAPRYKGYIIYAKDEKTLKEAKKIADKNKKADDLGPVIRTTLNNDSTTLVSVKKGLWAKGENKFVDSVIFKSQEQPEPLANFPYFTVVGKLINQPETYTDVKGQVISDLQEIREKEWINYLREKYPVEVDEAILKTIK